MTKVLVAASVGFLIAIGFAFGQTQTSNEKAAAEFIVGNCFRALDDISRVKSTARMLKWQVLPPDMANAFKPVDGEGYEAWHVIENGQHFFVGVNTAKINGRSAQVCSVVANHRPSAIVPLVLGSLKTKLVKRDTTGFQLTETYQLQHPTVSEAILTVIRSPANEDEPPVSFGFMGVR